MSNFWIDRKDKKAEAITEAVVQRHRHLGVEAVRRLIDDLIFEFEMAQVDEMLDSIQRDFQELQKSVFDCRLS